MQLFFVSGDIFIGKNCKFYQMDGKHILNEKNRFRGEHFKYLYQKLVWSFFLSLFWFARGGNHWDAKMSHLRVEFLLKTESGYLRDTGVTWFTLANP